MGHFASIDDVIIGSMKCLFNLLPSTPRTGLQGCLIVIIKCFLIHLHKLLPLNFSTDNLIKLMGFREENLISTNLVEIFRCSRNRTSLWLWQFFLDGSKHGYYVCPIFCHKKTMPDLLIIPLLCAARNMDPNTPGAEVTAANVASHRGHPS